MWNSPAEVFHLCNKDAGMVLVYVMTEETKVLCKRGFLEGEEIART